MLNKSDGLMVIGSFFERGTRMTEIFFRTDLRRFKPALGKLYLMMIIPKGETPVLRLAYYLQRGKYVIRKSLATIDDFVATEFQLEYPGIISTAHSVENDLSIVGVLEASGNAILAFARLWKEGIGDFLDYVEAWGKRERLEQCEVERVLLIARQEVERQQLFGHRR